MDPDRSPTRPHFQCSRPFEDVSEDDDFRKGRDGITAVRFGRKYVSDTLHDCHEKGVDVIHQGIIMQGPGTSAMRYALASMPTRKEQGNANVRRRKLKPT